MYRFILPFLRRVAPSIYAAFPLVRRLRYDVERVARTYRRPRTVSPNVRSIIMESELSTAVHAIRFPTALQPDISIIVPVYNQIFHTITCLLSLSDHVTRYVFE